MQTGACPGLVRSRPRSQGSEVVEAKVGAPSPPAKNLPRFRPVTACSAMTTRRETLRRSFRLPLSLGRRVPALTADVSRGGFSAELSQVFLPGSTVDGYFLVDNTEVAFKGHVVWAQAGNPMLSLSSRIGVKFDVTPEGLKKLFTQLDARPRKLKAR